MIKKILQKIIIRMIIKELNIREYLGGFGFKRREHRIVFSDRIYDILSNRFEYPTQEECDNTLGLPPLRLLDLKVSCFEDLGKMFVII